MFYRLESVLEARCEGLNFCCWDEGSKGDPLENECQIDVGLSPEVWFAMTNLLTIAGCVQISAYNVLNKAEIR